MSNKKASLIPTAGMLASTIVAMVVFASSAYAEDRPIYTDPNAPLELRVEALFQAMTPEERLTLLSGTGFTTQPVPRLGVPPMAMVDASQGVRGGHESTQGKATLFASSVLLGASWDLDLARRIGRGIGTEALNKGTGAQILLGPGVNIMRAPLSGRNGENISEDPYLAARMGVAFITGIQETGCSACVKHYACNNQEFERTSIDARVGERALRELYTPAFIAAVREGKVWAVMSAYNRVNGSYASANWYLQKQILKTEAGFDGIMMSDWGGLHSTLAINEGCDLEMPGGGAMAPNPVSKALKRGKVLQANVDEAVHRVIRTIIRTGLMDGPRQPDPSKLNTPEHQALALEAAEKGMVLLKNEHGLLPLDPSKVRSIALIGPSCKQWQMGIRGSGNVDPFQSVNAYDGIVKRVGSGMSVTYEQGCGIRDTGTIVPAAVLKPASGDGGGLTGEYFNGHQFTSTPVVIRNDAQVAFDFSGSQRPAGITKNHFCVRWRGSLTAPTTGIYRMSVEDCDGARLFIDGKLIQDTWPGFNGSTINGTVDLVAGKSYPVRLDYVQVAGWAHVTWKWLTPGEPTFPNAVELATKADVAVVFVGSGGEGEERDRPSLALPGVQNDLIRAVAAANKNTIVVLNNGGPVLVSDWIDHVSSAIEAFLPAQSGGTALANILFGDVNPSGKMTYTMAKRREDYPDFGNYPGRPETVDFSTGNHNGIADYKEGIYVGYRHFDKMEIAPSFPFGHGLSYTTFAYATFKPSSVSMSPEDTLTVTADITNTGTRAGTEVVQLYIRANQPKIDRPMRELKGFARVELKPGEAKPISISITARDLAYCDVPGKQWKADAGTYSLELGSSSRDLRATVDVKLSGDYTFPLPGLGAQAPKAPSLTGQIVATASSFAGDNTPDLAIDAEKDSRWESEKYEPQWLSVDLGQSTLLDHASIQWERAHAKVYDFQISDDGHQWTTVYTNADSRGGLEEFSFKSVKARWVRLLCSRRATEWGYSIFNFQVFPPDAK